MSADADTHEVVAVELTQDHVGDVSELVGLLDQVATPVASVIADGAYDGEIVYDAVTDRHPKADIMVLSGLAPTQRTLKLTCARRAQHS